MDYEKKYKEALERARQFFEKPYLEDSAGIVGYIFPELKYSEDEWARKEMLEYCYKRINNEFPSITIHQVKRWLTWLEKQGEQSQKHFELKAGHWYICHRAYCCRADHLTVKEGERFMCEKDGVVKGFVIKEPEKYFREVCAPAPMEDKQKPAWSEEDERMYQSIMDDTVQENQLDDKQTEWLRDIKERNFAQPQSQWKPSDAQMASITCAVRKMKESACYDSELVSLLNDLKKLKG